MPRFRRRSWSPEELRLLNELVVAGASPRTAAEALNRAKETVRAKARMIGCPFQRTISSDHRKCEARRRAGHRACRWLSASGIHPMGRSRAAYGIYDRQEARTKIDAGPSMVRASVEQHPFGRSPIWDSRSRAGSFVLWSLGHAEQSMVARSAKSISCRSRV